VTVSARPAAAAEEKAGVAMAVQAPAEAEKQRKNMR